MDGHEAVSFPNKSSEVERVTDSDGAPGGIHQSTLSRKEKRRLAKKAKRKQQRVKAAEELNKEAEALSNDPSYQRSLLEQQAAEEQKKRLEEEQRKRDEARWLEQERVLAAAAALKREAATRVDKEKVEKQQEPVLHGPDQQVEHLEAEPLEAEPPAQARGDESEEEVDGPPEIIWEGNQITVRKRKVKKSAVETVAKEDGPTHNPLYVPIQLPDTAALLAQAESDADKRELCQFFMRTGACRHFAKCSRKHPYPSPSHVVMVRGMFTGLGPPTVARTEDDASLEHTEDEVLREFEEFYDDVLPEFEMHGTVTNFKVCQNTCSHLRGNVYVSYEDKEAAVEAFTAINGRFYGGKQLVCEYAPFTHWRSAICGIQRTLGRCQHGNNCNYLHCFRNPGGAFAQADFAPVDQLGAPRRSRSHSVERTGPYRSSSRRHERPARSPSRISNPPERRRDYGADDSWRSERGRGRREEWSIDRSGRDQETERSNGRRRSREGRSRRNRSESRSPRARRRRSPERDERVRAWEESRHRERPERLHREGSREGDRQERKERGRSWSRERRRRDAVDRSGSEWKRKWDEGGSAEAGLSEGRKRSSVAAHQERHHRNARTSPGRREDVTREGEDRWQGEQGGDVSEEGLQETGSPALEHREDAVKQKRSHRPRKRRRDDEGGADASARSRRRKERGCSNRTDHQGVSAEGARGEPSQTCEEPVGEDPAQYNESRGRWDPDQGLHGAERNGEIAVPTLKIPDAPAGDGFSRPHAQGGKQAVRAMHLTSGSLAEGSSVDLDMHLLELRRAVEQSFKRRRLKSSQIDAEVAVSPSMNEGGKLKDDP